MLYDRWLEVAKAHAAEFALADCATGRAWTFAQLASAVDGSSRTRRGIVFPRASGAEFILEVLRAWRSGCVVCPLEPGQPQPAAAKGLPREIIHLKVTSATTGAARLVAFTAAQLAADPANIVATMGLRHVWPNLGVISLAHSYGFSNLVLPLLLHGIPLILAGATLPEVLRRVARDHDALTLAGIPALWWLWHEAGAIPENVALAISAGAPLPASLEHAVFESCGLKIHNFYGSSETGGIAYDASCKPRRDGDGVGTPMRNVEVRISPEGTVEVRSAAVAETYWPQPDPRLGNGVFRTSDVGRLGRGQLYLLGRAGDMINVAGRKVLPETVEKALSAHPDVKECLVFGVPATDANRGETIVACVCGRGGKPPTPHALKRFLSSRLPGWQVPRGWWLMDSMPATRRGKRSRAEWRERYLHRVISRGP